MRRAVVAGTSVKPLHNLEDISSRALLRTREQAAVKNTVSLYLQSLHCVIFHPLLLPMKQQTTLKLGSSFVTLKRIHFTIFFGQFTPSSRREREITKVVATSKKINKKRL